MTKTLNAPSERGLFNSWSLVWELTKRQIFGRYKGATLGLIWTILTPLLMLAVYYMAFGEIMKGRWPGVDGSSSTFAILIFAGLIVHGFFAELLTQSPALITGNTNYVKKVIFPLEILPWPMIFSALFHLLINLVLLLGFIWTIKGAIPVTAIYAPIVLAPLVFLMAGISWILSSVGVYFRDLVQIVGPLSAASLFLSSVAVPMSAVPQRFRWLFDLNPITFIVNQLRDVTIWGEMPKFSGLLLYTLMSLAVMTIGYIIFTSVKKGFADVL
ncbi:ABC transporter permease [Aquilutibacter rugosus]|uniref:ABC transporter permease n=1 Tax=Aquilutibacter rugosus TaxID=3115820 RepID=UPI002F414AB0